MASNLAIKAAMPKRNKMRLDEAVPGATSPRRGSVADGATNLRSLSWSHSSAPVENLGGAASAHSCATARSSAFRVTSKSLLAGLRHFRPRDGRVPLFWTLNSYCGTFDILRLLMRGGEATEYALSRKLPQTPKAIASSIHYLEWLGLIEKVPNSSDSRSYQLTNRSKELLAKPLDAWPSWFAISPSGTAVEKPRRSTTK